VPASPGAGRFGRGPLVAAAALFVLAAAACGAVILLSPFPRVENDAAEYLALAQNVALGKGFTADGVTPGVYRPPLFSVLLGLWFAATGTSSPVSAAFFQTLLHALGVVAAFFLFREVTPSTAWAARAAAFLAVTPLLITRVVFVLQEPTLLLFTTLACLATARLLKRPSAARSALAGAAWGVCTLAKIVSWYVPLLLLALRVLTRRLGWCWRRRDALALLLAFACVIAPWTARNYARFRQFIPVNGQGQGMLEWKVGHAEISGEPPGGEVLAAIDRDNPTPAGRRRALWRHLFEHPGYFFVRQPFRNAISYAAPPRDWWILAAGRPPGEHGLTFWLLVGVGYLPFYLALLLRTGQLVRGKATPVSAFLVLLLWSYWVQHALLWGDARFNLALYPVLVAMALPTGGASTGVSARDEHEHPRQAGRARASAAGCAR